MPKRDDSKYIEIENFKDYELTNCIVYEMVIRNNEFKKIKKIIFTLNNAVTKTYTLCLENDQKEFEKIYNKEFYTDNYYEAFKKYLESENRYKTKYCKKWKVINRILTSKVNKAKDKFGLILFDKAMDKWINNANEFLKGNIESSVYGVEKDTGKHIGLYADQRHKRHGIKTKDDIRDSFSSTKLILSRPNLEFTNIKETNIKFNMALPLKELEAQLKEIKKQFHEDNTKIQIASEIFGASSDGKFRNEKYPKKTKAVKMADWFFIYDSYKILKESTKKSDLTIISEIDLKLIDFYRYKEDDYYSTSHYQNTILPTMKKLIENLECKQLLTSSVL